MEYPEEDNTPFGCRYWSLEFRIGIGYPQCQIFGRFRNKNWKRTQYQAEFWVPLRLVPQIGPFYLRIGRYWPRALTHLSLPLHATLLAQRFFPAGAPLLFPAGGVRLRRSAPYWRCPAAKFLSYRRSSAGAAPFRLRIVSVTSEARSMRFLPFACGSRAAALLSSPTRADAAPILRRRILTRAAPPLCGGWRSRATRIMALAVGQIFTLRTL